jgi:hypothetical protein
MATNTTTIASTDYQLLAAELRGEVIPGDTGYVVPHPESCARANVPHGMIR